MVSVGLYNKETGEFAESFTTDIPEIAKNHIEALDRDCANGFLKDKNGKTYTVAVGIENGSDLIFSNNMEKLIEKASEESLTEEKVK